MAATAQAQRAKPAPDPAPDLRQKLSHHGPLRLVRVCHLSWPWRVLALVCISYLLINDPAVLGDGDTFLHIRIGQWIWQQGVVPTTDVFSYTAAGQPWVAHEWLAGLAMAGLHAAWGLHGLNVAAVLCTAAALAIQMQFLMRHLPVGYALALVVLAAMALHTHQLPRPHAYTWPLMAMWFALLWQAAEAQRVPPWWCLGLMTLWANLHGGFVLGLALVLPCAALAVATGPKHQRRTLAQGWLVFGLGALVAACMNPYGIKALAFVHSVYGMAEMKSRMNEWMPYNDYSLGVWSLLLLALAGGAGLRWHPVRLACVLALLYQAFTSGRFIAVLGLMAPFVLAQPLAEVYRRYQAQMALTPQVHRWLETARSPSSPLGLLLLLGTLGLLACLTSNYARYQPHLRSMPVLALEALRAHGMHGHGLNHQGAGGYLILQGVPVFIDGRVDMYGERHFLDYVHVLTVKSQQQVAATLQHWDIQWALLTQTSRLAIYLQSHPQWQTIYQDSVTIALVRRPSVGEPTAAKTRLKHPSRAMPIPVLSGVAQTHDVAAHCLDANFDTDRSAKQCQPDHHTTAGVHHASRTTA